MKHNNLSVVLSNIQVYKHSFCFSSQLFFLFPASFALNLLVVKLTICDTYCLGGLTANFDDFV